MVEIVNDILLFPDDKHYVTSIQFSKSEKQRPLIRISHSALLSDVEELSTLTKQFLTPVSELLPFLFHFHSKESIIFDKLMGECESQELLTQTLSSVKGTFEAMLTGTVKLQVLVKCLSLGEVGLQIRKETTIIESYPGFQKFAPFDSLKHFEDLLLLREVISLCQNVCEVVQKFQLRSDVPSCIEKAKQFTEEELLKLSITEVTELVKEIKRSLEAHSSDELIAKLKVFEGLATCRELYVFLIEQRFVGNEGSTLFYHRKILVATELQNSDYDSAILNHLEVTAGFILSFYETGATLRELLKQLSMINLTNFLGQLKSVSDNIEEIRHCFSSTEVISLIYCMC